MIVPIEIIELYKASLENRKSVTIYKVIHANGSKPPPLYIIVPGEKVMEAWVIQELVGKERIRLTTTRYTNNEVALKYLDHLILHLQASLEKPWKILLIDSHESYKTNNFQLKAIQHYIFPFYFPFHLTHALQPLDIGVFRPWKYFHKQAISKIIRSLEFNYSVTSFFTDLTLIR
jgi:hypothetical protein